ncbi:MAG: hypothetical protein L6Q73_19395 [Aquabacterium sp.]|nr:hypothetical protein [Aquabacterium sp.]
MGSIVVGSCRNPMSFAGAGVALVAGRTNNRNTAARLLLLLLRPRRRPCIELPSYNAKAIFIIAVNERCSLRGSSLLRQDFRRGRAAR